MPSWACPAGRTFCLAAVLLLACVSCTSAQTQSHTPSVAVARSQRSDSPYYQRRAELERNLWRYPGGYARDDEVDDLRGNGLEVQQSQVRETKLVHKIKGYTPLKQDSPRSADGQQQHPGLQLVHDANRRGDNRDPKRQMERFIEQEQEQQHGDSKLSKPGNRLEPKEPKKPNPEIIINEDGFDFQDTGDSSSSSSSASDHKGFGDSGGVKRGSGYGTDWPTTPPLTDSPAEQPSTLGGAAGGCKAGFVPTTVMGSAVVIDNSMQASKTPYKASSDCMGEPTNTLQYGGTCELSCTEVADYGRVVNTFVSITTGSEGQTVCGALRFSRKDMAGICSVIPVSHCCEPAGSNAVSSIQRYRRRMP